MNSPKSLPPRRLPEGVARRAAPAFTLTELLVVMLVILVLLGLTVPLVRGIMGGRNVSDSLDVVADYLTYARTQAMTQNTYTVVGFYQAKGSDDLQIGSLISANGTFDPAQFASTSPAYNAAYPPLGRIVHVQNVTLTSEAALGANLVTKLKSAQVEVGISDGSVLDCLSANPNNASSFSFLSGKTVFGKGAANPAFPGCIIVFSPQGEALSFPQAVFPNYPQKPITLSSVMPFYGQLFIGLRSTRNGNALTNDQNSAALTLDGGSGSIKTYRL